jgi:hypothetical protein
MSRLPLQSNQNEVTVKPCACNTSNDEKHIIVARIPFQTMMNIL